MDNTISDNTFRLNINAREHDSYLPSRSTVSNSESFEARTSDTSLSKASGSETSLEDSYEKKFERTMTADQAEFTFQHTLSSTFTKMRSLFGYFWNKGLPNEKHLYEYFWKWHSVFSQWYPCTFTVDGITYSSAEQYMMHQKAGKIFCCTFSSIWNDNLCFVCFVVLNLSCYPIISYHISLRTWVTKHIHVYLNISYYIRIN